MTRRWLGRWLCAHGRHDWLVDVYGDGRLSDGRAFRRVGETVPCRRGCGAMIEAAGGNSWRLDATG